MEEIPIGRTIALARHRKRWTQQRLADALGVSKAAVANWETGKHYPQRNIGAIEAVLDISLAAYDRAQVAS
jgi:transcriptional regulator with XRE-family HTH domain